MKTGQLCQVTFTFSPAVESQAASLCGEFNNWDKSVHPMRRLADGKFSTTISLAKGSRYRFRYLVDDEYWITDWSADSYVPNEDGIDDSVIRV